MTDAVRRLSIRLSLVDGGIVERQLRDVGRAGDESLGRIRDSAQGASRALDLLDFARRAAGALALGQAVRSLVSAGDAYTASLGRLTQATGSIERARDLYETLYRNALQTGVAVTESVDAFQRFAIAARAIGATSDQVAQLVGGLQRAAIVGGSSAQEIGSATLQLAQALASGRLQGDELRAVLEAMPLLAEALAAELGVSVGQLRELGSEGQLTAERIFPALLRASERLNAEFERAPLTLGRAFGQLEAAAGNFLAQLDQAVGLTSALARGISGAAQALDRVRGGVGLLSPSEVLEDRRRQAQALAGEIARLEAGEFLPPARRGTIQRGAVATAMGQTGVGPQQRLAELRQQYIGLLAEIELAERDAALRGIEERERAEERALQSRRERAAREIAELAQDVDRRARIEQQYGERVRTLNEALSAGAIDAAERDRLAALAVRERDAALARLEPRERAVTRAVRENTEAERERQAVTREVERLIRSTETAYEAYQRRLEELGRLAERAERSGLPEGVTQEQFNTAIQREAEAALKALSEAEDRTRDAREAARELGFAFSSAFEDAIVRGERLSGVLQGLAQDVARIIARRTITEPLGGALSSLIGSVFEGFSFSSLFSGIGGLFRAEGGPVVAGRPYIVGERGPEWFVPRQSGVVLPNGTAPGGVVINTSVAIDARGADAGVEARLRLMAGQIARQASALTLDAIRRGGAAYDTVRA
ncbi:tape measure protein [Elioraea sp. Yellowstone]|uniref:tape measure protein n=1 Tax=Elioraea sp. Yellowstone TaxID=2592070 RepID=UPI001150D71F|nr:tape measure protein [Elioraea sp. Yellowstone]TQF85231.1 tape measure protein [Elioraea sp. Yellowstone]